MLMHAGVLLHSNIETTDAIPEVSLAATTRAYARIIDESNNLPASRLPGCRLSSDLIRKREDFPLGRCY